MLLSKRPNPVAQQPKNTAENAATGAQSHPTCPDPLSNPPKPSNSVPDHPVWPARRRLYRSPWGAPTGTDSSWWALPPGPPCRHTWPGRKSSQWVPRRRQWRRKSGPAQAIRKIIEQGSCRVLRRWRRMREKSGREDVDASGQHHCCERCLGNNAWLLPDREFIWLLTIQVIWACRLQTVRYRFKCFTEVYSPVQTRWHSQPVTTLINLPGDCLLSGQKDYGYCHGTVERQKSVGRALDRVISSLYVV